MSQQEFRQESYQYEQREGQQNGQQNQQQVLEKQEVQNTSYTHTDVKVNMPHLPAPFISTSVGFAQDLIGEGFQASVSRITGSSNEVDVRELDEAMSVEAGKDLEAKEREQQLLTAQFEKELERKTEAYRKQQEIETEKIRKELEKQHLRDVEFRKELVEQAIENQKRQIDLEARYAKKELERERNKARLVLERSKFHTDIQVNMEAAAGNTKSGSSATTVSESEKFQVGNN